MEIELAISDSFNLDFEILKSNVITDKFSQKNDIFNPKLKSDDIFTEFEDYVKETKEIFFEIMKIFDLCNKQRKV